MIIIPNRSLIGNGGCTWHEAALIWCLSQEGAGDALASSLTAIAEPLQQLAPSIASSMDAEDSASMCASAAGEPGSAGAPEQHRPQPARARRRAGSKRKGPWVSVYSGPERSCRVDGELAIAAVASDSNGGLHQDYPSKSPVFSACCKAWGHLYIQM